MPAPSRTTKLVVPWPLPVIDRDAAALDRDVGDEWIADHDSRGSVGQLQDPGLIDG